MTNLKGIDKMATGKRIKHIMNLTIKKTFCVK